MNRRLWKVLLIAGGLLALLLGGARWWVGTRINADEIVRILESSRNCRVSVGAVSVRVFGFPARVEVRDLKITPRDESLKPAVPGETFIRVGRAVLEVELLSLLTGNVDVESVALEGVEMQTVKWEGGGNSLRLLLAKPGTTLKPPTPKITLEDEDEIPAPDAAPGGGEDKPWHVSELPLTSTLREARISNATWTLVNQRRKTVQQWKDGNFTLTGMTLNPDDPSTGGTARITASTRLILDNQKLQLRSLDFILGLEGKYQLVDPKTGYINNDLAFGITVKKGSLINRIPTLVKLNERLQKLESSMGLSISLPPEATLTADTVLRARLQDDVIRLTDDVFFPFDTYQVGLDRESWLSLRDELHQFTGRLLITGDISKKAVASLQAFLEKRSGELAGLVSRTVLEKVVNKEGNIELPFKSEAELGRPEVKLSDKLLDAIKRAGAEAGKDLLKDALEGGDDLENIFDAVKKGLKKDK